METKSKYVGFQNSEAKNKTRVGSNPGILSIVSSKDGKRLSFSNEVMEELENPVKIQIAMDDENLAISENLPDNENYFNVKLTGKKSIVYAADLVNEIIEHFDLDFSDVVCMTFHEVVYIENEESKIAVIKIK